MITQKIRPKTVLAAALVLLLLASVLVWESTFAQSPTPHFVGPNTPVPLPPYLAGGTSQLSPATLSSSLSYYFIPGSTFKPAYGSTPYVVQVTGCVNQMPLGGLSVFNAPVHLPQGSQVVSITLYTYDTVMTTTVSSAQFILMDGKGLAGYTVSAGSQPNTAGYQQNTSAENNPATIDNQSYGYYVNWYKSGVSDSPYLSLCGVRVAYHPPLGATYLPFVEK